MEKEGIGKKILIVEDKEDSRILLRKILMHRGYVIIEAGTGEDAINMAKAELPDLILMDVRLPGAIDGLEATRQIKALPNLANVPILAVTASVRPEDIKRALGEGCSGFIRKPIDIDELPIKVAEYIVNTSSKD